ncbi:cytochrome c peroxidase [Mucilaginibacter sp. PAMB04168]|uniref:cytochrome-c peroxidase n=1 Tax=Mucilaginibacter sp. PAMB04168 TaxID=3138567 RepID=UPI0031F6A50F
MKKLLIVIFLLSTVLWLACRQRNQQAHAQQVQAFQLLQVQHADSALRQLRLLVKTGAQTLVLQQAFKNARLAYKRTEFLTEYYTPVTAKALNGAPIPVMDDNDQHRIDLPEGFQVVEPYLFPVIDGNNKAELLKQLDIMIPSFKRLKQLTQTQELADAQIFDAMRLEVFRIITQGITGFDAPIAQNSMAEASAALSTLHDVLAIYEDDITSKDENLYQQLQQTIVKSRRYLSQHTGFNSFNRMAFIMQYANPLSVNLAKASHLLGIDKFLEMRALKANAKTVFDEHAFDPDYYTASYDAHSSPAKVELGKRLFYDPILSGTGKRSCASCHEPPKAFTDGLVKSESIDGKTRIRRNTPTLLNAGLQPALFYDNRVAYLEDQATDVINNKDEMHGSLPAALKRLGANPAYNGLFKRAFPKVKEPVTDYNLRNALGSYIRSLESLNSPFDKYMRGDSTQLNAAEVNGFNLYMGKAKCATCHFMPLFNGTVPPDYRTIETEVIGVPAIAGKLGIDDDKGKYELRKINLYKYAFRTPTVRNIALTAPYMHNGVFKTLEDVVDFYNKGGGLSAGANLPNLTLPFDELHLTPQDQKDIVAFLKKLTDTGTK